MKSFLFALLVFGISLKVSGQQEGDTIWIGTGGGNIYTLTIDDCSSQFICATGKSLFDIALTPDGRLWGNTSDTLYQIFANGSVNPVGKIPSSASLVGLNDSTLLIDSMRYLIAVNNNNAATHVIGYIGYIADGDLTWLGKDLYMVGQSHLVKITLDSNYSSIEGVDTILLDAASGAYYTPGLTTAYIDSIGYTLIALPGNVEIYKVDTSNGHYQQICVSVATDTAHGASSMIFPPNPPPPLAIHDNDVNVSGIMLYPNPTSNRAYINLRGFKGKYSEVEVLCYDYMGRLLARRKIESNIEEIGLDDYRPGLYIIQLNDKARGIYRQKLIKK